MIAVAQFANTFVGKPGNIGVRTARVLDRLATTGARSVCVCRGAVSHAAGTRYVEMGWLGHLPRLLNGLRTYVLPRFNHRKLDIALFERYAEAALRRSLEGGAPGVAHVWDFCPRLIRRLKREGLRVVLDVPIAPLAYGRRMRDEGRCDFLFDDSGLIEVEEEALAEADVVVAPSLFVADELRRMGLPPEKITVIEFGADSQVSEARARTPWGAAGVDFCFMGLVNPRKGVLELLDAFASPEFRGDRLHLCGRVFPAVSRHLAARRDSGTVITPGFVRASEYLARCDVFVFPSWMEGSAKSVYEAMASGLPVIATHSAGSIVRDGVDGFLIAPGDVRALRERMAWMKENPGAALEMGARGRERVRSFSWERYADRVIEVYRGPA